MDNNNSQQDQVNDRQCLSINDVLSCCHDDSAGGGILYLFEEKLMELAVKKAGIENLPETP